MTYQMLVTVELTLLFLGPIVGNSRKLKAYH